MALFGQQPRKDEPAPEPEPRVEPPPTPVVGAAPAQSFRTRHRPPR